MTSDPRSNPRSSGTPGFLEQCGLFRTEPDRRTRGPSPLLGLMSSLNLTGRTGTTIQPLVAFHQLKPSGAAGDEGTQSVVGLSRTREEARHVPTAWGTRLTSTLRDTSATLYPCSTSQGQRNSTFDDPSKFLSSYFPPGYRSTSENNVHKTESVTNSRGNDKTETKSSRTKYTPELATKILLRYGLEKEDLEQLLSYPEDQITAMNLPFVLQQIRKEKEKKTSPEPQLDKIIRSEGTRMYQDNISSNVSLNGVTATGLCGTAEVVEETVCSGALSIKDANGSGHRKELQLKGSSEGKLSSSASSYNQDCPKSLSSIRNSVALPTSAPTDQPLNQTSPSLQEIFDLFYLPKQDTNMRFPQIPSLKDPKSNSAPETQTSDAVVPPDPCAFELDCSKSIHLNDQNENQEELEVVEPEKNQDQEEQPYQTLQQPEQPEPQMEKTTLPQSRTTLKPASSPSITVVPPAPPQPLPNLMTPAKMLQKPFGSLAGGSVFRSLPPAAKMEDYAAATPETFPHTCSLCNQHCANVKDWIYHQNYRFHLENCKLLRKRYPSWDGQIPSRQSFSENGALQFPSPSAQTYLRHDQKIGPESRSRSGSNSPNYQPCRMEDRRDESRSRSRSPSPYYHQTPVSRRKCRSRSGDSQSSRYTFRSRSPSPWYNPQSSDRYRSRSRSPESRSSSRKSEKKLSWRTSRRRPTDERSSYKQRKRSTRQRLTKRLLKVSALRSLLEPPKLKVVVKTLVPLVLAELKKMKFSSSSSSRLTEKRLEMKLAKAKSVLQRMESVSSTKPQAVGCFEDDAEKLERMTSLDPKGASASVVTEKDVVVKKRKKAPQHYLQKTSNKRMVTIQSIGAPVESLALQTKLLFSHRRPTTSIVKSSPDTKAVPPNKTPSALLKVKNTKTRKLLLKAKVLVSKAKTICTNAAGKRASALSGSKKRRTARVYSGNSKPKPRTKNTEINGDGSLKASRKRTEFVKMIESRGTDASRTCSSVWSNVPRVESLRSLKQRLRESREILKNLEVELKTETKTVEENPVSLASVKPEPAKVEMKTTAPDETTFWSRSGESDRPSEAPRSSMSCPPGAGDGKSELDLPAGRPKSNDQTQSLKIKEENWFDEDDCIHEARPELKMSSEKSSVADEVEENQTSESVDDGTKGKTGTSQDVCRPHRNKDRNKSSKDFTERAKILSSADDRTKAEDRMLTADLRTTEEEEEEEEEEPTATDKTTSIKDRTTRRTSTSEGKSKKRQNLISSNTVKPDDAAETKELKRQGAAKELKRSNSSRGETVKKGTWQEDEEMDSEPGGPWSVGGVSDLLTPEDGDESPPPDWLHKDSSGPSGVQIQETEPRTEDVEQRRDLIGPGPHHLRSVDLNPTRRSDPRRPVGQEFVVPKWGFFCSLCSVFYLNRDGRRDAHCCSRTHYDNLQKFFQKHKREISKDATKNIAALTPTEVD